MRRYASLASTPGQVGIYVQTQLHEMFGMTCCYHPCTVTPVELGAAVTGLKVLGFDGFAVSSPHKLAVLQHVDAASDQARDLFAANTVVRDEYGLFVAHNTDVIGFDVAYRRLIMGWGTVYALVLGAGPAARAVCSALYGMGVSYMMASRPGPNKELAKAITSDQHVVDWIYWDQCITDALVINTVPSSAFGSNVDRNLDLRIGRARACIDITSFDGRSTLMQSAKRVCQLPPVDGLPMAIAQSMKQFELYTGRSIDDTGALHMQLMKGWRATR